MIRSMSRLVKPEQLDSLDPFDPKAQASRRDIALINRLMGNFRWFERALTSIPKARPHALEWGAGSGELAGRLHQTTDFASYTAIDFAPRPPKWPKSAVWHTADILRHKDLGDTELLLANLILHHFTDKELERLGQRIRRSHIRHILANEPCRRPIHKWQLRAGRAIGFHSVTLNDGCISIDAGFRGDELPQKLGLPPKDWRIRIRTSAMGAYRMEAHRR